MYNYLDSETKKSKTVGMPHLFDLSSVVVHEGEG